MTIAFVSASDSGSSGTSTSVTVNAPASIVSGNLLLAFLDLASTETATPPSGWSEVGAQSGSGGNQVIAYSKTATGSEPASYTFTSPGSVPGLHVAIVQYSGNDPVTVGYKGSGSSSSGTSWSNPSWTATGSETSCWSVLCVDAAYPPATGVANQRVDSVDTADVMVIGDTAVTGTTVPAVSGTFSTSTFWVVLAVAIAEYAAAPAAPTLTAPGNAAYLDGTAGVTYTGIGNSTDGANINARAMRQKPPGGSYSYWNVGTGAFQSTIVWNSVSIAPGASGSFGPITLTDGQTVNWSMADQESKANLQGPFATDYVLNLQTPPTVTISGPAGTVTNSSTPPLTYTATPTSGTSVTGGRWLIYPLATTQAPGFSINIGAGTIPAGAVSDVTWTGNPLTVAMQTGVSLTNGDSYVAYTAVTETGPEWSSTVSSTFTLSLTAPAAPLVTAAASTDPTSGAPTITVTVVGQDTGGFVGHTSTVITRTEVGGGYDSALYDSATYDAPAEPSVTWTLRNGDGVALPASNQTVTVVDTDAVPGVPYTYTAVVQEVYDSQNTLTGPSTTSSPVTAPVDGWWLIDPLEPSNSVELYVTDWKPDEHEQLSAHYGLGWGDPDVQSDVVNGVDGTLTVEAQSLSEINTLRSVYRSQRTLHLVNPWGQDYYVRLGAPPLNTGIAGELAQSELQAGAILTVPYTKITLQYVQVQAP